MENSPQQPLSRSTASVSQVAMPRTSAITSSGLSTLMETATLTSESFSLLLTSLQVEQQKKLGWAFSMYDQDGNCWIDLLEMTRIVKSIYSMMGPDQVSVEEQQSPEERAQGIFTRMD